MITKNDLNFIYLNRGKNDQKHLGIVCIGYLINDNQQIILSK